MKLFAPAAAVLALHLVGHTAIASAQTPPPAPSPGELVVPPGYGQAPAPQQWGAQQPAYEEPGSVQQSAGVAMPPQPDRHGFTLELGLGIALLRVRAGDFSELGLNGLNLSLGGFLNPSVAIEARITGVTLLSGAGSDTLSFLMADAQYWANDWLMMSAGLGFGMLPGGFSGVDLGFALDTRIGAAITRWNHGVIRIALEFIPSWLDPGLVTMTALALEYQYY